MTAGYPIDDIMPALKEAVAGNSSVVLHAPPGAGKTTRVPLALLDTMSGRILVLEPRRIAAVSAARWMAHLLGEEVGRTVGYSIRFKSRTSSSTQIEVVTEGIFTRRIQNDPGLAGVAMVIFDEFHERSLQADTALTFCLDVTGSIRKDLKILVMSATLDCGPVASLLGGAPVISSSGMTYPVDEVYLPENGRPIRERVVDSVKRALNETEGDILVFFPGAGEIFHCAEALSRSVGRRDDIEIHPLYGDLPFDQQERAILLSQKRKVVLATNIAETSLTIEGVRVVIDTGLARRLQYDPSTGMNRLVTVTISRASAEQRKGRAGRLGPGVCYRLYSRQAFQSMTPFSPPEISVSELSSLVLDVAVWGVKDPVNLSWLDAPPPAAWNASITLLSELGALDRSGSVTPLGKAMARLPLHPRLARLVLLAVEAGNPGLGADLAAMLSERDIIRRRSLPRMMDICEPDIGERVALLRTWRKGFELPDSADEWAIKRVDRTSRQLLQLVSHEKKVLTPDDGNDLPPRLLLCAFPDRIAKKCEGEAGRFLLVNGRGIGFASASSLDNSPFIVAVQVDAGVKGEGVVHIASPLTEELIRQECADRIDTSKKINWDKKEKRIIAALEERLGAILLSDRQFQPSDDEAAPVICEAIRSAPDMLQFSEAARQFLGRAALMKKAYPEESWPDLSKEPLAGSPEKWLLPWIRGMRSAQDIEKLDILPALRALFTRKQERLFDERMPAQMTVPSGHRVVIDYTAGDIPVLAVKLQEMFGLADTPTIAGGRVKLLLHLLSPARRPVQITYDLKGFWDNGYRQVKKELKGRYPKHPWPDNPWNAPPTRKTKGRA